MIVCPFGSMQLLLFADSAALPIDDGLGYIERDGAKGNGRTGERESASHNPCPRQLVCRHIRSMSTFFVCVCQTRVAVHSLQLPADRIVSAIG